MTLNHVHLGCIHFEECKTFYQSFFGFRVESQLGRGVFMRNASGFLLVLDPVKEPHLFPEWFHLGFCQEKESRVYELHEQFRHAGAKIVRELVAEEGEYAAFYVEDPDGVRIEVSWHAQ